MHRFRTLTLVLAAFCFAAGSLAGASGPKSSHRPMKVSGQATKHTPRAPKTHGAGQRAAKPSRPADGDKHVGHEAKSDTRERKTISSNISKNPELKAKVEAMLPSGMTIEQASAGFRNQGQFIAALNASKNHNISFTDLKTEMTGDSALSLGEAIQKLKPASTSKSE